MEAVTATVIHVMAATVTATAIPVIAIVMRTAGPTATADGTVPASGPYHR